MYQRNHLYSRRLIEQLSGKATFNSGQIVLYLPSTNERCHFIPLSYFAPYISKSQNNHHHHHGGPSVSRMTLSVPLICGYGSGSAGRSWTCRAVRSLGTGSSHLSLGYRLPSGGVLWRTVLDGDALPLAQITQIVKVCFNAVCPEQ